VPTAEFSVQGVDFEWDEDKAGGNLEKHGVGFREAAEAFFDPFCVYGDAIVDDEEREFVIGYTGSQRLLLVVYVERGHRSRIISARLATREERRTYERA
jgi:uncharacterized DUF497 family protein